MPKHLLLIINICLVMVFLLLVPGKITAETGNKEEIKHIFIISVDGLNYEGFISTLTPNILKLAREGIIDEKSMALKTNSSEAAEASLLSGTLPDEHQFFKADDRIEVDTIIDLFDKNNKSYAIVDGSGGRLKSFAVDEKQYICLESSAADQDVLTRALEYFEHNKPFFNYIYINDCKQALLGLNEKEYYDAITGFDKCIGEFTGKLKKENLYYNSLIIITSPLSSSPSNLVPLIMYGPKCRDNTEITDSMVIDIVPTICKLTNMESLFNAKGIPLYDTIVVDDKDKYVYDNWIDELKKERVSTWSKYYILQDECSKNLEEIESLRKEKESIFDFLGKKDETIAGLKSRILVERIAYVIMAFLGLIGYIAQYRFLKKKFLFFD